MSTFAGLLTIFLFHALNNRVGLASRNASQSVDVLNKPKASFAALELFTGENRSKIEVAICGTSTPGKAKRRLRRIRRGLMLYYSWIRAVPSKSGTYGNPAGRVWSGLGVRLAGNRARYADANGSVGLLRRDRKSVV